MKKTKVIAPQSLLTKTYKAQKKMTNEINAKNAMSKTLF